MLATAPLATMVSIPYASVVAKGLIMSGVVNLSIATCKKKDKDIDLINEVFKNKKFCNLDGKYAYVKYVKEYNSYKMFRIVIPLGKSVEDLESMIPSLENVFKNIVFVKKYETQYYLKVFTKHLKYGEDYPFEVYNIEDKSKLSIVIGMSLDGVLVLDLSDTLPHILIGATSRAGKSRLIKGICCQVMMNYTKDQVQIIFCDQKNGVEASVFEDCEHFVKTTSNAKDTAKVFNQLEKELDKRYNLMHDSKTTTLYDYNKKHPDNKMPYILVLVDELYPFLALDNKKEVYATLADLMSRSAGAGVHFIISSQKTTSEIIPTFITENAGYRLGLRTGNAQGSLNIIDRKGCEDIPVIAKGRGLCAVDDLEPFQAFWVDDETVSKICKMHEKKSTVVEQPKPEKKSYTEKTFEIPSSSKEPLELILKEDIEEEKYQTEFEEKETSLETGNKKITWF